MVAVLLAQEFKNQIDKRRQQHPAGKRGQAEHHRRAFHKRREQGGVEQRAGGNRGQQQRQPLPVKGKAVPELLGDAGGKQAYQRRGQQNIAVQQLFAVQPEQHQHRRQHQRGPVAARKQDQQRQIDAVRQEQRRLLAVMGQVKPERPQHQPAASPGQHDEQRDDAVAKATRH